MLFSGLHSKLQYWNNQQQLLQLKGLSPNQWCLLAGSYFHEQLFSDTHVLICSDQDEAEDVYEALKHLKNVFFYPGHNHSLYSTILTSESSLLARWSVLQRLVQDEKIIIVTTWEASLMLGPDPLFFKEKSFVLKKDDIISPLDLASRLTQMGYFPASTVEEPGTFSRRGGIFDIYPVAHTPIRLHYFDDLIEEIFGIDLETQKTLRDKVFNESRQSVEQAFTRTEVLNGEDPLRKLVLTIQCAQYAVDQNGSPTTCSLCMPKKSRAVLLA